jgi:hypothetical protein
VQRGFYLTGSDDGTGTAARCEAPCVACTSSACNCERCETNSYLLNTVGTNTCTTDPSSEVWIDDNEVERAYFPPNDRSGIGIAVKCQFPCVKCSETATNCKTCEKSSFLFVINGIGTCIFKTSPSSLNQGTDGILRGFYFVGSYDGTGTAETCIEPCIECIGKQACTKCPSNQLLFSYNIPGGTLFNKCIEKEYLIKPHPLYNNFGFFQQETSIDLSTGLAIALLCPSPCPTCLRKNICLSCQPGLYLYDSSTTISCIKCDRDGLFIKG